MGSVPIIGGIILAGGKSQRLGTDKALLKLGGQTLIENVIEKVSQLSQEVIVVANVPPFPLQSWGEPGEGGEGLSARLVGDVHPGKGALGGIYSGLLAASHFHSLVVACDMPFLNLHLLRYMALLAPGYDVVLPRLAARTFSSHRALGQGAVTAKEGHLHPLHAIYSKRCLGPIKELLEKGDLRIIAFFSQVRVRYVEQEEIDPFDPHHLSLFNINTPADVERAQAMISDGLPQASGQLEVLRAEGEP